MNASSNRAVEPPAGWLASLETMLARIRARDGKPRPFEVALTHGTARIGVYAPRGGDDQVPHAQDEVYIVARGSGVFVNGADRQPFKPGDMLFVPAGAVHRFERFSDDFAVWVVFYGPEGGERPAP
jgi:mannose-6-phosphate isomerase-like protein (cupin superfamily)